MIDNCNYKSSVIVTRESVALFETILSPIIFRNASIAVDFLFTLGFDDDAFAEVITPVVIDDAEVNSDLIKSMAVEADDENDSDGDGDELLRFIVSLACIVLISYSIRRLSVSGKTRCPVGSK